MQRLSRQDIDQFIDLVKVFEDVFEMKNFVLPEWPHLHGLLGDDHFMAFVAIAGNKVIGGLTAYVLLQYYNVRPLAYIYDLAVKREFQRKGIGKKLVAAVNSYCKMKGFEEVFVHADKADGYALDFYRSTNITDEEQVVHFYYKFRD